MLRSLRCDVCRFSSFIQLLSVLILISLGTPARAQLLGDLTGDGSVTVADATRLWGIVRGLEFATLEDSLRGDVFPRPGIGERTVGDGMLDSLDVDRILDYLVGNVNDASFFGTPAIEEVRPYAATPDDTLSFFSVFGEGFLGISLLSFEPADSIAVDSLTVFSDTFLQAGVRVFAGATAGIRHVRVVSPAGTSPVGAGDEFEVYPPSGVPLALACVPQSLDLVAGSGTGFIELSLTRDDHDSSTVTASSADPSVASVASSTGRSPGAREAVIEVIPETVGTTTISGSWLGQSFSVAVNVTPPEFSAIPDDFYLFQTGLIDSLMLFLSPQREACTILLQSSNPGIVSVPSTVTMPANGHGIAAAVTPESMYGDAVVSATLPSTLGGEVLYFPVHVEELRVTIYSSQSPVTVSDNGILDDPSTPTCDEGFAVGTGGLIIALNGASRMPQPVWFDAEPMYVGGNGCGVVGVDGFRVMSPVVIPPHEVFWANHFGGIIEGAASPPVSGVIRARLALNPPVIQSVVPVQMSFGPPVRQAVRFADSQVGMVPGQPPRLVVATVDQANNMTDTIPSWSYSVTGDAVAVMRDPIDVLTSRASLFLRVIPLHAGSSVIRATCWPEGFTDSVRVNVLAVEFGTPVEGTSVVTREGMSPQQGTRQVDELNGISVAGGAQFRFSVKLPDDVRKVRGSYHVFMEPDYFRGDVAGPDIAEGGTQRYFLIASGRIENAADLKDGKPREFTWNVKDRDGQIVRPGRYRAGVLINADDRDRWPGRLSTEEEWNSAPVLNLGQVVWLKFGEEFIKDLWQANIITKVGRVQARVRDLINTEFRDTNNVNVLATLDKPAGFEFKTLEIGGMDPDRAQRAFGMAPCYVANTYPGDEIVRARGCGVFWGEMYAYYFRRPATPGQRGDVYNFYHTFNTNPVIPPEGYDPNVAADIMANCIATTAVHELGHTFGLVAGRQIAAFARNLPEGVSRYRDWHNGPPTRRFHMNGGGFDTLDDIAMIRPGKEWPFAPGDYGMVPNDWSPSFTADCLTNLRRLFPRGETVR